MFQKTVHLSKIYLMSTLCRDATPSAWYLDCRHNVECTSISPNIKQTCITAKINSIWKYIIHYGISYFGRYQDLFTKGKSYSLRAIPKVKYIFSRVNTFSCMHLPNYYALNCFLYIKTINASLNFISKKILYFCSVTMLNILWRHIR